MVTKNSGCSKGRGLDLEQQWKHIMINRFHLAAIVYPATCVRCLATNLSMSVQWLFYYEWFLSSESMKTIQSQNLTSGKIIFVNAIIVILQNNYVYFLRCDVVGFFKFLNLVTIFITSFEVAYHQMASGSSLDAAQRRISSLQMWYQVL